MPQSYSGYPNRRVAQLFGYLQRSVVKTNIEFEAPISSLETTAYRTEDGTIVTHLVNATALEFGVRSPIGDVTVTSKKEKCGKPIWIHPNKNWIHKIIK